MNVPLLATFAALSVWSSIAMAWWMVGYGNGPDRSNRELNRELEKELRLAQHKAGIDEIAHRYANGRMERGESILNGEWVRWEPVVVDVYKGITRLPDGDVDGRFERKEFYRPVPVERTSDAAPITEDS